MKRSVDVVLSLLAMLVLMPFAILIALCIWLESRGPVLARPHRVGRNGRMVKVFEFHTAVTEPDAMEMVGGCHDEQVTRVGGVLRRLGIAQWPLLINVLRGDLSLVGPRAELPRYVGCYPTEDRKLILSIKPGLADLATIEFADEKRMLAGLEGDELEQAYVEQVLPIRLNYAKRYVAERGFWLDTRILFLGLARGFLR